MSALIFAYLNLLAVAHAELFDEFFSAASCEQFDRPLRFVRMYAFGMASEKQRVLQALVQPEKDAITDFAIKLFTDPQALLEDQRTVMDILGTFHNTGSVQALIEAQRSPHSEIAGIAATILSDEMPAQIALPELFPVADNPFDPAQLYARAALGGFLQQMDPHDPWYPRLYNFYHLPKNYNKLNSPPPLSETLLVYIAESDAPSLMHQIATANISMQMKQAMYLELLKRIRGGETHFHLASVVEGVTFFEKLLAVHILTLWIFTEEKLNFLVEKVVLNARLPLVVRCYAMEFLLAAAKSQNTPPLVRARIVRSVQEPAIAILQEPASVLSPEEQEAMGQLRYFLRFVKQVATSTKDPAF